MLIPRVLTALVLLPLLLGAIFGLSTPVFYAAIAGLVGLAAAWEWAGLMGVNALAQRLAYMAAMAAACAFAWWLKTVPGGRPGVAGVEWETDPCITCGCATPCIGCGGKIVIKLSATRQSL